MYFVLLWSGCFMLIRKLSVPIIAVAPTHQGFRTWTPVYQTQLLPRPLRKAYILHQQYMGCGIYLHHSSDLALFIQSHFASWPTRANRRERTKGMCFSDRNIQDEIIAHSVHSKSLCYFND